MLTRWASPTSRRRLLLGSIALAVLGLAAWNGYMHLERWANYDLNPEVLGPELVGTWQHGSEFVALGASGAFSASSWPKKGTWSRLGDFELLIGERRWRILRSPAGLVLCSSFEGDPDGWGKVFWTRRE
jgi:hypothetical protein